MPAHRHPVSAARSDRRPPVRASAERRPFLVPVTALRRHHGASRRVEAEGPIDDLGRLGVSVPEGSPVTVDVELTSDPGGLSAVGTVTADWVGECRRCGGPVGGSVVAAVRERFVPADAAESDEDAYPIVDDQVDLDALAREAVLLELPLAPLCRDTCLGLCPQCGTNWNESPCECRPAPDPRWSVLDQLRQPPG